MRLRVVNLGLPKSGTTTLAHALKLAGLKVADYRIRRRQTPEVERHNAYVADLMYRGYFETGDPLAHMDDFDGFSEVSCLTPTRTLWPQTDFALIQAIRGTHPGVRFVASRRDARAMSDSMLRWSNLGTERLPAGDVPGLPAGYGATTRERITWIDGHYAHLRAVFAGDPAFLDYDTAEPDAPALIAAHIGRDLPWWGKANRNPQDDDQEDAA
jgi:hypothetical protein